MHHQVGHGNEDHRLAALGQRFVVLGESSVLSEPGKGALDNPSFGQHDELDRENSVMIEDMGLASAGSSVAERSLSDVRRLGVNTARGGPDEHLQRNRYLDPSTSAVWLGLSSKMTCGRALHRVMSDGQDDRCKVQTQATPSCTSHQPMVTRPHLPRQSR